jgi:hypothetical protein
MSAHYRKTHERQGSAVEGHMVHRSDSPRTVDPAQIHRERQAANQARQATASLALSSCSLCSERPAEGEKDGIPVCVHCYLELDLKARPVVSA